VPSKKRGSRLHVTRGERYALIPEEVMEHDSYHAQPDWARSVLFALAARYNGNNNGDLSLPFSEAKRLGISAQWKLYAGLRLLEKAELIQCARRGRLERGTKLASLYALTWRGINECPNVNFDAGISSCPIPSNAWVKWAKPDNWKQLVRSIAQANHGVEKNPVAKRLRKNPDSTALGAGRSTALGVMSSGIAQQPWVMESSPIAPMAGDTSKTSGLGHGKRRTPAPVPLPDPLPKTARSQIRELNVRIGKARQFLAAAPGTDDAKLMEQYQLTHEQVQQLKASNA
jgi:hypothetical protein